MMQHYDEHVQLAADRRRALMHEAAAARMAGAGQVYQPGLSGRILARVGDWMIAEGTRLKIRYEDASVHSSPFSVNPIEKLATE